MWKGGKKYMENINELLEILKMARRYIYSDSPGMTQAIYRSPVQQLRNQVDLMEAKERNLIKIDEVIRKYSQSPN